MKKCPSCQKTFDDSMRFCQVDGTPLVDDVPAFDPYATIVARPITPEPQASKPLQQVDEPPVLETPAFIPPVIETPVVELAPEVHEPVVPEPVIPEAVGSTPIGAPDDLLDLPDADPLKTMFVSDDEMKAALSALNESPKEPEIIDIPAIEEPPAPSFIADEVASPPPSPFLPSESPEPVEETTPYSDPFSPTLAASDTPSIVTEGEAPEVAFDEAATMIHQPFPVESNPVPASPFSESPVAPVSPFAAPEPEPEPVSPVSSPFDSSSPYPEPQADFQVQSNSPFDAPPVESAAPVAEWNPPPAPVAAWQNKEIGANTPFQPPAAGAAAPSYVLAIVSLALGIVGLLGAILTLFVSLVPLLIVICGILPFLLGVGAVITGFLARSRAKSMPDKYSGGGLALGGLLLGVLDIVAPFVLLGLWLLLWGGLTALGAMSR